VRHGSFGLLVRDLSPKTADKDDRLILTAAHLVTGIADGSAMLSAPPGPEPGNNGTPCGIVRRRVPLHNLPSIAVDAAVIKPYGGVACSNEAAYGMPNGIRDLFVLEPHQKSELMSVRKHGAASHETTGSLLPCSTSDLKLRDADIRYTAGWDVYGTDGKRFAERGDSGSIVVDENKAVVGMLVAVDEGDGRAFFHGIKQIFAALNIALYD
jgi:hypothetical protein